jgi:hypothetical protein
MRQVALYTRISTDRKQPRTRRGRTIAARAGWNVVKVYRDEGISGAKGRDERPSMDYVVTFPTIKLSKLCLPTRGGIGDRFGHPTMGCRDRGKSQGFTNPIFQIFYSI